MRLIATIFAILSVGLHVLSAQSQLNKKIDFQTKNTSIEDALIQLSEESETNISFSNKLIPTGRKLNIEVVDVPIKFILREILKGTDLSFKIVSKQVILYKRNLDEFESIIISGIVEDAKTGEKLIGASVYDPSNSSGTNTNDFGFYSINILKGASTLSFSYTGYETKMISIDTDENETFNIKLESSLLLPQIVVKYQDSLANEGDTRIEIESIEVDKLELLPSIGGEADLIRNVYNISGVSSGSDGVGGLHVRGGGVDQNLILMDGVPIYNPFHALGVFSVFNTEAIRKATFYKGSFPTKYSGRLSSILDIQTKEGNLQNYSGSVDVGLISGKATIEGPIVKDKASFFISGRRSFTDLYIPSISEIVKENNNGRGSSNYLFWDVNAKVNVTLSKKDRLYLSAYKGQDSFVDSNQLATTFDTLFFAGGFQLPISFEDQNAQSLDWTNETISLRWNRIFGDKMFANTNLYFSRYQFNSSTFFESIGFYEFEEPLRDLLVEKSSSQSSIQDIGLRTDFEYIANNYTRLQFGAVAVRHKYQPQNETRILEAFMVPGAIEEIELGDTTDVDGIDANELQVYFGGQHNLNERINVSLGFNTTFWQQGENFDFSMQPRLNVDYKLHPEVTIGLSASKMDQYQHLLTNSDVGLPSDIWLPATERVPVQTAIQGQLQLTYDNRKWGRLTVASYYKQMDNLIEYLDESSDLFLDAENWEDNVTIGSGYSWGLECSYEKSFKKAFISANYTFSQTDRVFDQLNDGNPFPYRFDLTHVAFINLAYKFNRKLDVSLAWSYQSGINITFPNRRIVVNSDFTNLPPFVLDVPSTKNGLRVLPNHKLDLGINYMLNPDDKFKQSLHLGVYNVYNRINPLYYQIVRDETNVQSQQLVQVFIFRTLPNFSYSVEF